MSRFLRGAALVCFLIIVANVPLIADSVLVTDALGREVRLPSPPERIVIAGAASLMVADAVYLFPDAWDRVVGVTRIDQGKGNFLRSLDPRYREKTILERNVGPEQVAALRPDLVLMKSFMKQRLGDGVQRLGLPVVYLDLETPQQYERDLETLGRIMGARGRAQEINTYFETLQKAVESRTQMVVSKPRVLFVYRSERDGIIAFNVPPTGWIQTTMIEMSGGRPVWTDTVTAGRWSKVGLEQIAAWDPDHIVLVSYRQNVDLVKREILEDSTWAALRAVQAGQVHAFPVDFYSWDQPDVRWVLGLTWLAKTLHPELYVDVDLRDTAREFYAKLYGMDSASVDRVIFSILEGDLP